LNNTTDTHDIDLVAPYVLDALEPEERAAFEAHLQTCEVCRLEVAELSLVVDVLPLAVELVEPPAGLKNRIIDAIAEEPSAKPALTALPGGASARQRGLSVRWYEGTLALVAAVVIAGLGVWNLQLQHQVTNQKNRVAYQLDINRAILSGATVTRLPATSNTPAQAAMVQPKNGAAPYLLVNNLPATPSNKVYELWYMRGTVPTAVKVFTYSGNDPTVVPLSRPTTSYGLAAITLERGPNGTKAPTTKPIVLGKLTA
jgi:anti-sigma-K factor RskA